MTTHTVQVTLTTQPQAFPAATVSGGIRISIASPTVGSIAPVTLTAAPYAATFIGVPAGDYSIVAQALDSTGSQIGAAITSNVTIAQDVPAPQETPVAAAVPATVNIDMPMTISVLVS